MEKSSWCSRHCRKDLLGLEYPNPSRFPHGPWKPGRVHPLYLAYRLIWCVYLVATIIWGAITFFKHGKWFIFVTHWSYMTITLYNLWSACMVIREYIWERKNAKNCNPCPQRYQTMPWHYKVTWVLYNISVPFAFSITTWYWNFVYNPDDTTNSLITDLIFHSGNSIFSITELIVGAPPVRFVHIYQVLTFAFSYLAFYVAYWAFGGTNEFGKNFIYPVMDWNDPPNALKALFVSLTILIIVYLTTVVLSGVRSRIVKMIKSNSVASDFTPELIENGKNKPFVNNV